MKKVISPITSSAVITADLVTEYIAEGSIVVLESYGEYGILTRNHTSDFEKFGSSADLFFTPLKFSNDGGGHWDGDGKTTEVSSFISKYCFDKNPHVNVYIFDNYAEFGNFLSSR